LLVKGAGNRPHSKVLGSRFVAASSSQQLPDRDSIIDRLVDVAIEVAVTVFPTAKNIDGRWLVAGFVAAVAFPLEVILVAILFLW